MKEKMAKFLQELYSNLGLPKSTIESVAGFAIIGLQDTATDDEIKARASEESVKTMLQSFQSDLDRARSGKGGNKGGNDPEPPADPKNNPGNGGNNEMPEWVKTMMEQQNATIAKLTEKINGMEQAGAQKSYEDRVKTIAAEYNLKDEVLALCKMGLSADMTDDQIRETIGKNVKTLQDAGAVIGGGSTVDTHAKEEARKAELEADANAYVARMKAQQQNGL